ncbi:MAG: hypothetical protein M3347_00050, partial [Armatimonadota bacterium]|nr:hypothetical protein [Armatimonadota bacterium]
MSTVPNYWFYPHIFREIPGQYAYQSVWLTPTRNDECPVCGAPESRVGVLEIPLRGPRVTRSISTRVIEAEVVEGEIIENPTNQEGVNNGAS